MESERSEYGFRFCLTFNGIMKIAEIVSNNLCYACKDY